MLYDNNFYNSITSSVRNLASWVQMFDNTAQLATFSKRDALKSWEIQRVGDTSKFFGFGICHRLNIKLIDKERAINVSTANHFKVWICPEGYALSSSPFPIFYVSEVHRDENTNELSITAYDRLYQAMDKTLKDTGTHIYTSIYNYAMACASTLSGLNGAPIAINFTGWNSADYPQGANYNGEETLRAVLDDIAEATQSIYYINNNNQLVFKRIDINGGAVLTIRKDDYFTLDSSTNRRLGKIYHVGELGDDYYASLEASGTTQYIHQNPFWALRDDIANLLSTALDVMGGMTINQFECAWRGNPALEIADKVALITKDNETITAYLLNDTLSYDGTLNQKTEWRYDSEGTGASYANTGSITESLRDVYAKVDKVNNEIDLMAKEVTSIGAQLEGLSEEDFEALKQLEGLDIDELKNLNIEELKKLEGIDGTITEIEGKMAQIELETEGITSTVQEIQTKIDNMDESQTIIDLENRVGSLEVKSDSITSTVEETKTTVDTLTNEVDILNNKVTQTVTKEDVQIQITERLEAGIDSITTTTGFTFDEKGLTIDKSGTEMSTQITEDGMTVYRDETAVLTANNVGVEATNLHATTYLIIGKNSRFEDYQGNRTGCFWIGE